MLDTEKSNQRLSPIYLPAIRGVIGDWYFYCSAMTLVDLTQRVDFAKEVHESTDFNKILQRAISKRAKGIADYIQREKERFFGALVVGLYGGSPEWGEVSLPEKSRSGHQINSDQIAGSIGVLRLSGNERMFALDGQHRLAGIRLALKELERLPSKYGILGAEQVPVILVGHENTEKGIERTRRLFTTLNRYAVPTEPLYKVLLDENDVVAIVTRRIIDSDKLFKGRVVSAKQASLPPRAKGITTVVALYQALDTLLIDRPPAAWSLLKRSRPSDKVIQGFHDRASEFAAALHTGIPALRALVKSGQSWTPAAESAIGSDRTGVLVLKPVGLYAIATAAKYQVDAGGSLASLCATIGRMPQSYKCTPWLGLLWRMDLRKFVQNKKTQRVAALLMFYVANSKFPESSSSRRRLSAPDLLEDWGMLTDEMKTMADLKALLPVKERG